MSGLVEFSVGATQLPGGRLELTLDQAGALRVRHRSGGTEVVRAATVDPAVPARVLNALRNSEPGVGGGAAEARRLVAGELTWADGTGTPVPGIARLLEALAGQLIRPELPGQLPSDLVQLAAVDPAEAAPTAAIGTVSGRPAFALAVGGRGFGLAELADNGASLGASDAEAGLLPTAVALGRIVGQDLFAVGAQDGAVQVWDATTGALLHGTSGGEGAQVVAAAVVEGVPLAFSGGRDGEVRAWRAEDGKGLGLLAVNGRGASALVHANCAGIDLVAAAGGDGTIRVWDAAAGARLHLLVGHTDRVTSLAVLSLGDQAVLASGGVDREIRLWDLATGEPLAVLAGHSATVTGLAFTELAGEPLLASCALDGTVRTWDVYQGTGRDGWATGGAWLTALAVVRHGDGQALAVGDERGRIRLFDPATGTLLATWEPTGPATGPRPLNALAAAAGSDGSQLLAAGYGDGTVRLWEGGLERFQLAEDGGAVSSVAVTDGLLVCGTVTGAVRCHRLADGAPLSVPTPHTGPVTCLAFGESTLVSAGADGVVRVRRALDGTPLLRLAAHQQGVTALAIGPQGERPLLATAGGDRTVRLWDAVSGEPGAVLTGLTAPVAALAFATHAGRPVVLAGTADGAVRAFDTEDGRAVTELAGGAARVRTLVCQEMDGEALVAAGDEQDTVRLWHLGSSTLLNEAPLDRLPLAISFTETGLYVVGPGGAITL
ncbi:WD40 repeat domain-containing protein [Kitasatospora sp. NPDC101801]|uniref:WD40 repeat domain-containing protein n=1 Tax=Kitasatospora sp. NPDC101801 TaxID=3364103 RepID=UPI003823F07A